VNGSVRLGVPTTCALIDSTEPLRPVTLEEVPNLNDTSAWQDFGARITCDGSVNRNIRIRLVDALNEASVIGSLTKTPNSSGGGVRIQLTRSGFHFAYPMRTTWQQAANASLTRLPLKARYVRVLGDAWKPGLAKAIGDIRLEGGAYVNKVVMQEASGDHTEIVFSAIQTGDKAMTAEEGALFD